MTDHLTNGLDEIVHQRHRLGILTITADAKRAEFGYLREALDLTPGNLSRHLTVLEGAGLVDVEKGYDGRRPRTVGTDHPAGPVSSRGGTRPARSLWSVNTACWHVGPGQHSSTDAALGSGDEARHAAAKRRQLAARRWHDRAARP